VTRGTLLALGVLVLLPHLGLGADPIGAVEQAWLEGDLAGAEEHVRAFLVEEPENPLGLAWLARLSIDPRESLGSSGSSEEEAVFAWTRGNLDSATELLLTPEGLSLHPFLSGLLARRLGDAAAAREHFATVQPSDPDYAWARYQLARLAMQSGESALARRYLETAEQAPMPTCPADVLATRWELSRVDDANTARRYERELAHRYPDSLALSRLREIQRNDRELTSEQTFFTPAPEPEPTTSDARYALQFGAYSDRGRAMTFRDAWRQHIPGIAIMQIRDAEGRMLYRIRSGHFTTRSQATAAAEQLSRRHDLTAIIVELAPTP